MNEKKSCMVENHNDIQIRLAVPDDAPFIAWGLVEALGWNDGDEEKLNIISRLVTMDDVLYSWQNAVVAYDSQGQKAGVMIAYDGADYARMRTKTFDYLERYMPIPYKDMEDESKKGEFYLDSLAVAPQMRKKGIGRQLLEWGICRARMLRIPQVVLAVDPDNQRAQALYRKIGFLPAGELHIFGGVYWRWVISLK